MLYSLKVRKTQECWTNYLSNMKSILFHKTRFEVCENTLKRTQPEIDTDRSTVLQACSIIRVVFTNGYFRAWYGPYLGYSLHIKIKLLKTDSETTLTDRRLFKHNSYKYKSAFKQYRD